jgi:hypothetical protein
MPRKATTTADAPIASYRKLWLRLPVSRAAWTATASAPTAR